MSEQLAPDFQTGQAIAEMTDREITNMRRTPRPARVAERYVNDNVLAAQLTEAAMPAVIAAERDRKLAMAKDPYGYERLPIEEFGRE